MAMDMVRFGEDNIANVLARMKPNEIDQLPFGVVQVDENGKVLFTMRQKEILLGCPKKAWWARIFLKISHLAPFVRSSMVVFAKVCAREI